jgi:hypothetical protein
MARQLGPSAVMIAAAFFAVAASHAKAPDRKAKAAVAQAEKFCEQERQLAEPWIQWAFDNKMACIQQTAPGLARDDCFHAVVSQLDSLQKEHAEIYLSQMKTIDPGHPVMASIMARLSVNREFAITALQTDTDPMQLASLRKQTCLSQQ